ncbi:unnamed protein product [Discosporangium mesarthrocarpum]
MWLSRFIAKPTTAHFSAAKRLLGYLKGSMEQSLQYQEGRLELKGLADASYICHQESGRSISGYMFTLVGAAISWSPKLQPVVAHPTTGAEYIALGDAAKEVVYLDSFITEPGPFNIHEDNMGALHLASANSSRPRPSTSTFCITF